MRSVLINKKIKFNIFKLCATKFNKKIFYLFITLSFDITNKIKTSFQSFTKIIFLKILFLVCIFWYYWHCKNCISNSDKISASTQITILFIFNIHQRIKFIWLNRKIACLWFNFFAKKKKKNKWMAFNE